MRNFDLAPLGDCFYKLLNFRILQLLLALARDPSRKASTTIMKTIQTIQVRVLKQVTTVRPNFASIAARGVPVSDPEEVIRERHSTRMSLPQLPVPRELVDQALAPGPACTVELQHPAGADGVHDRASSRPAEVLFANSCGCELESRSSPFSSSSTQPPR